MNEAESEHKRIYRVLVFGIDNNRGGIESFLINAMKSLPRQEIAFDVLENVEKTPFDSYIKERGGNTFHIGKRSDNLLKFRKELRSFFESSVDRYDAIWINVCSLANIDYLIEAKRIGIPKRIIHCHNASEINSKVRLVLHYINRTRLSKYATHFWSCSDTSSKWFFGSRCMRSSNYKYIPNAINIDKYKYNVENRKLLRKKICCNDDTILIGNVGRLHPQKNQKYLLEIFSRFHSINKNSKLIIIGTGELLDILKRVVEKLNLIDSVIFAGMVDNPEMYYSAMDVFVFPSLYEGMSIALLEAQANGLPCIISDGNPIDSIINNNVYRLKLNESIDLWVNYLRESVGYRVANDDNKMVDSVHNIYIQSKILKNLLLN